jgi:hypothetical protein
VSGVAASGAVVLGGGTGTAVGWAGVAGCSSGGKTIGELPVVRSSSSVKSVFGSTNQRFPFLSNSTFSSRLRSSNSSGFSRQ